MCFLSKQVFKVKVIEIQKMETNSKGQRIAVVKIDKNFKSWISEVYNMKRWSKKKFEKLFFESIGDYEFSKSIDQIKVIVGD